MIETERLLLRRHEPSDWPAQAALFGDAAVMRFIGGAALAPEEVWHRLLRYAGHWSLLGFGMWAVTAREDGRLLGEVGFADFRRGLGDGFDGHPEAAWILAAEAQGRGLAREAMAAAAGWLDAHHPAPRSVCMIAPDNAVSLRLAGRLGYRAFGERRYRERPVMVLARERGAAGRMTAGGRSLPPAPVRTAG